MSTKRLRCWIGRHRRVAISVTVEVWPLEHGYCKIMCPDCGKTLPNRQSTL